MFKIKLDLDVVKEKINNCITIANTGNMLANLLSLVKLDVDKGNIIINYIDKSKKFSMKIPSGFEGEVTEDTLMLELGVFLRMLQLCSGTSSINTGDLIIEVDTEKHILKLSIEHYLNLKEVDEEGKDVVKTIQVGKVNQTMNFFSESNIENTRTEKHRYNLLVGTDFDNMKSDSVVKFNVATLKDLVNRKSVEVSNLYFSSKHNSAFTTSSNSLVVLPYGVESEFFYIIKSDMAKTVLETMGNSESINLGAVKVDDKLVNLYFTTEDNDLVLEYKMDSPIKSNLDMFTTYTSSDYSNKIIVYKDVLSNVLNNLNKLVDSATHIYLSTETDDNSNTNLVVTLKSATEVKRFDIKVLNEVTSNWNIEIHTNLLHTLISYCRESKITLGLNETDKGIKLAIYDTDKELSIGDLRTVGRYYTSVSASKRV